MSSNGDSLPDRQSAASPTLSSSFNRTISPVPFNYHLTTSVFSPTSYSSVHRTSPTASEPGPSSLKRPGSPLLRKTQSFKLDEGYGEGIEESHAFQDPGLGDSQESARANGSPSSNLADIKVPDWMLELSDDVRQGKRSFWRFSQSVWTCHTRNLGVQMANRDSDSFV